MDAQQLHYYIIKPTLQYRSGNYYSKESAFLLLCTAAIESNCGEFIKQINGPALGVWQMEPATQMDIYSECDALKTVGTENSETFNFITDLKLKGSMTNKSAMILSPMYSCSMSRLEYSMDPILLPILPVDSSVDLKSVYEYYKRVYNTELGASTYDKWYTAIAANHVMRVKL